VSATISQRVTYTDGLSRSEQDVLRVVADHAWHDGTNCTASVSTIAKWAILSQRRTHEILAELKRRGWLMWDEQGCKGGHPMNTMTRSIDVTRLGYMPKKQAATRATERTPTPATERTDPCETEGRTPATGRTQEKEVQKSKTRHTARAHASAYARGTSNGVCDRDEPTSTPHEHNGSGFDAFRKTYVTGTGGSWEIARREFQKRLQEGYPAEQMIAAAAAYSRHCEDLGIAGSSEVMWPYAFLADPENFVRDWAAEGERASAVRWWETNEATDAMARELGLSAYEGELYPAFRQRIAAAIRKRTPA